MEFNYKRTFQTENYDYVWTPYEHDGTSGYYAATCIHTSKVVAEITTCGTSISPLSTSFGSTSLEEIAYFMRTLRDVGYNERAKSYTRTQQKRSVGVPLSEVIEELKSK